MAFEEIEGRRSGTIDPQKCYRISNNAYRTPSISGRRVQDPFITRFEHKSGESLNLIGRLTLTAYSVLYCFHFFKRMLVYPAFLFLPFCIFLHQFQNTFLGLITTPSFTSRLFSGRAIFHHLDRSASRQTISALFKPFPQRANLITEQNKRRFFIAARAPSATSCLDCCWLNADGRSERATKREIRAYIFMTFPVCNLPFLA